MKILQFIAACLFVVGGAVLGAFLIKDAAGVITGGIAAVPVALLVDWLSGKLICAIRGYWRSLMNWPDFRVSGHDYIETEKDSFICETCGHELRTIRVPKNGRPIVPPKPPREPVG
jgi:hypothetical protein